MFSKLRSVEMFLFSCIVLNTIVLATNWYGMPKLADIILNYINHFFTFVFWIEAVIKLGGYGSVYFRKWWNIFDILILVFTGL